MSDEPTMSAEPTLDTSTSPSPHELGALRRRIALELAVLAVLTTVFLFLFPRRPAGVDFTLALVALGAIGANAGFTRRVVWRFFPPTAAAPFVVYRLVGLVTAALVLGVVVVGAAVGYFEGGRALLVERFSNPHILLAVGLYFPWALLQQTLFQFYLLGRLRTLLPSAAAIVLTGVGYSLVHLPDPWITAVTAATGVFWTWAYHRYRALVPLALSHAVLGAAFYYWVYGRDLAAAWLGTAG